MEISKTALEAAKKRLDTVDGERPTEEDHGNKMKDGASSRFTSFSTGSGKKVEISKTALQAAKKRLDAVDGERPTEEDCNNGVKQNELIGGRTKILENTAKKNSSSFDQTCFIRPSKAQTDPKTIHQASGNAYFAAPAADKNPLHSSSVTSNDAFIEMSERFEDDMMKTLDEDPSFLKARRKRVNAAKQLSYQSEKVQVERKHDAEFDTRIDRLLAKDMEDIGGLDGK